jgi:hypothetical protein
LNWKSLPVGCCCWLGAWRELDIMVAGVLVAVTMVVVAAICCCCCCRVYVCVYVCVGE